MGDKGWGREPRHGRRRSLGYRGSVKGRGGGGSNGMMGGKKEVKREGRQRDDGEGVKGEGGGLAKLAECIS